jgi:hypothetical protein
VPALLRAAGWDLVTLAEHYGVPEDERVPDPEWIREAAIRGWPILMKDKRIRYRRAEIDTVIQYQAKCFVITKGDLPSGEMATTGSTLPDPDSLSCGLRGESAASSNGCPGMTPTTVPQACGWLRRTSRTDWSCRL